MPKDNSSSADPANAGGPDLPDNWADSPAAKALKRMQDNPRVKYIVVIVPAGACPACQNLTGTYPKDQVPPLPIEDCSHPLGCRAFYLPYLDEIFP